MFEWDILGFLLVVGGVGGCLYVFLLHAPFPINPFELDSAGAAGPAPQRGVREPAPGRAGAGRDCSPARGSGAHAGRPAQTVPNPEAPAGGSASFPVCKPHPTLRFHGADACPGVQSAFLLCRPPEADPPAPPRLPLRLSGSWLQPCSPRARAPFYAAGPGGPGPVSSLAAPS